MLWVGDNQAETTLNSTQPLLGGCAALPPAGIDNFEGEGSAGSAGGAMGRYSFCARGAHGEPLAYVLIAVRNDQDLATDLHAIRAQITLAHSFGL